MPTVGHSLFVERGGNTGLTTSSALKAKALASALKMEKNGVHPGLRWRQILYFHITDVPSAAWTAQQMVEALPFTTPAGYLLRDRDNRFLAKQHHPFSIHESRRRQPLTKAELSYVLFVNRGAERPGHHCGSLETAWAAARDVRC